MDKNEIRAENISLICLLRTLKKNLWMIVAAAAIFAMLVSLYADFVRKPVYRASMTYAVTSRMSGTAPEILRRQRNWHPYSPRCWITGS